MIIFVLRSRFRNHHRKANLLLFVVLLYITEDLVDWLKCGIWRRPELLSHYRKRCWNL